MFSVITFTRPWCYGYITTILVTTPNNVPGTTDTRDYFIEQV